MSTQSLGRLVAAELLKVRTTRSGWLLPLVAIVLPLVYPVGSVLRADGLTPDVQESALAVTTLVVAMVMVGLGALAVTSEFRHHTVVPTTLAAPGRNRVLAAKYAAAAMLVGVVGLAAIATTAVTVAVLAAATGEPVAIGDELARFVPGAITGLVLWTSAGVAIGSALRNSAGALVGIYLGWAVLPMVAAAAMPSLVPWTRPVDAVGAVAGFTSVMSVGQAVATLAVWIAAPAAVGLLALRSDIT
jgi:ABC-2 type transport system permease protein